MKRGCPAFRGLSRGILLPGGCLFSLLLCLLSAPAQTPAERGQGVRAVLGEEAARLPAYHALIIGINDYQHWVDLRQARQDAQTVADLLRSDYGFTDVRTLYDQEGTRNNMVKALRQLQRELGPDDALLIYFSGHGHYEGALNKGYWIPAEAREKLDGELAVTEWLDNTTLREYIGAMKTRHVLVVSDSCFSGALFRGGAVDLSIKENTWYQRAIAAPSRWCITSGDLETVPDASVFARKLLQALQYPQQAVFSASDLAGWIKKEVAAASGRQPVFGPLKDDGGSTRGEFVFLRQASARAAAPAQTPQAGSAPSVVALFGTLLVKSTRAAEVSLDGGTPVAIASGRALKWDKIAAGKHTVRVTAGARSQAYDVNVAEVQTATLTADFESEPAVVAPPVVTGGGQSGPAGATQANPWLNSLGMAFVPVSGTKAVFCIWETRVKDYATYARSSGVDSGWSPGFAQGEDHPVCNVSWEDAKGFCRWLTEKERRERRLEEGKEYRLPTDAEWSLAVGLNEAAGCTPSDKDGKIKDVYPWGTRWPPPKGAGNYGSSLDVDSYPNTSPVGSFSVNRLGIHDLGGNVLEWCEDFYDDHSGNGVLRGASWLGDNPADLLSSFRFFRRPNLRGDHLGFRVVLVDDSSR